MEGATAEAEGCESDNGNESRVKGVEAEVKESPIPDLAESLPKPPLWWLPAANLNAYLGYREGRDAN